MAVHRGVGRLFIYVLLSAVVAGCAQLRHLTMTDEERRLYGRIELRQCMGDVVCIRP